MPSLEIRLYPTLTFKSGLSYKEDVVKVSTWTGLRYSYAVSTEQKVLRTARKHLFSLN